MSKVFEIFLSATRGFPALLYLEDPPENPSGFDDDDNKEDYVQFEDMQYALPTTLLKVNV